MKVDEIIVMLISYRARLYVNKSLMTMLFNFPSVTRTNLGNFNIATKVQTNGAKFNESTKKLNFQRLKIAKQTHSKNGCLN